MKSYSRKHVADATLMSAAIARLAQGRGVEADHLADIAAIEKRRLYLSAGYPSMFAFCVKQWNLCEQAAYFRIGAARAARKFPALFEAVADGRLHISAVVLLKPHLTAANLDELIAAATRKSKREITQLLAERYPQPDVPTRVRALPSPAFGELLPPPLAAGKDKLFPGIVEPETVASETSAPAQVAAPERRRPTISPLAPKRYGLQLTMSQEMHDDLRRAQELLSHQLPSGDEAQVLHRALQVLIKQLEKAKYAATDKPRKPHTSANPRRIPAHVRRAVEARDGGRCTFVAENGHRCEARTFLEFDHVLEVARGGTSTVGNVRLRCRAHNQYTAEQTYGADLMNAKKGEARRAEARPELRPLAMAVAVHDAQVRQPRTDRLAVLMRHGACDLVQVRHVVRGPGGQQLAQRHGSEDWVRPAALEIGVGELPGS